MLDRLHIIVEKIKHILHHDGEGATPRGRGNLSSWDFSLSRLSLLWAQLTILRQYKGEPVSRRIQSAMVTLVAIFSVQAEAGLRRLNECEEIAKNCDKSASMNEHWSNWDRGRHSAVINGEQLIAKYCNDFRRNPRLSGDNLLSHLGELEQNMIAGFDLAEKKSYPQLKRELKQLEQNRENQECQRKAKAALECLEKEKRELEVFKEKTCVLNAT